MERIDDMARYCLLVFAFALAAPVYAQSAPVRGYVYEDANQNRQFDRGEKGIANVLVSNQIDVVKTDALGRYEIPLPNQQTTVFIIKPAGYSLPLNEFNQPQFFYYYQPEGSPKQKFDGIAPTGELPASLDFALVPAPLQTSFDMIALSDPQMSDLQEVNYFRDDVVAELHQNQAVFGIMLGDIAFDDLSVYGKTRTVIAQAGFPMFSVAGNHDENYDLPDDQFSLETYKKNFAPSYYAFEYGMVSFIVLDSVEWRINPETKKGGYIGRLGDQQLQWIRAYVDQLPEDRLIVFAMHIPLYYSQDADDSLNITDRQQLFDILKTRRYLLAIAGHMHNVDLVNMGKESGRDSEIPFPMITCAAVCGAWWSGPKDIDGIPVSEQQDGTPNGYHIFHFKGNQFTQEFKAARLDSSYQMRICSPRGVIVSADLARQEIVVNVFNASDKAVVTYRLDGGNSLALTRQNGRKDPFIEAYFTEYKSLIPSFASSAPSSHIWAAPLPVDLASGQHTLTVHVVNQYGYEYQQTVIFEVE